METSRISFQDGWNLLRRSFSFLGKKKREYLFGWLLSCTELLAAYLTPFLYQQLVKIITDGQTRNAMSLFFGLFLILLLSSPLIVWGTYLKRTATAYGKGEMRKALFLHVEGLPLQVLQKHSQGDYISRLTNDVDRAVGVFNSYSITGLVKFVIFIPVSSAILFAKSWQIALLGMGLSACATLLSIIFNPQVRRLEQDARAQTGRSASFLMETFRNMPVIRVFLMEGSLSKKYLLFCQKIARKRIQYRTLNGISEGLIYIFSFCAHPIAFVVGIFLLIQNRLALSEVVFLSGVVGIMADGMRGFSSFMQFVQPPLVACQRVCNLLDISSEHGMERVPGNDSGKAALPEHSIAISVSELSFAYESAPILKQLSFDIRRGETVALVGSSGSGKTTLLKLLQGLYLPAEGDICFFGKSVQSMSLGEIRCLCAYVPQDSALFLGTVGENIAFGSPHCSFSAVKAAATQARADSFILSLEEQYDTWVGEGGGNLSGGQRQRIAIARAVAKNAPILFLDEATSALDIETEQEVQQALNDVFKSKTSVIVAHRLSTVKHADRILVMEKGKIVEEGTHRELIARSSLYRALYNSALSGSGIGSEIIEEEGAL